LLHVADASRSPRLLANSAEHWQQNRRENGDYRYHDQQLNQREPPSHRNTPLFKGCRYCNTKFKFVPQKFVGESPSDSRLGEMMLLPSRNHSEWRIAIGKQFFWRTTLPRCRKFQRLTTALCTQHSAHKIGWAHL